MAGSRQPVRQMRRLCTETQILSEHPRTPRAVPFNPWRRLQALRDVTLHWSLHLPKGTFGHTEHLSRTVTLHPHLTQAQRRSTLAHELVHLERGYVDPTYEAREERIVDRIAACRLITFDALADALVWANDPVELADDLWVDVDTVIARLDALTPTESDELVRRLEDAELHHP